MALSVIFTVRDAKGASSLVEINLPADTTVEDAQGFITSVAPLINALILGSIDRVGICLSATLPGGLRTSPTASSDVEEGARFVFNSAGGYVTSLRLPTFSESFIASGSNRVDTALTPVQDFITAMVAGAGTPTVQPSDYRGADITGLKSAMEAFQRSRRKI